MLYYVTLCYCSNKVVEELMSLITLRQLLDHAAENNYAVPAFNISNMEQGLAIVQAAAACNSPVILQASKGARVYAGDIMLHHIVIALSEMYPKVPICLHQDHGNDTGTCYSAMNHGFTSVMMDGSLEADAKTPASYEYNVNITQNVTEVAHAIGVSVEGELGMIGSLETGTSSEEDGVGAQGVFTREELLTDPDLAVDFVQKTKVDALAIACGTSHGAHKFSRKPDGEILAIDVIEKINKKLPNTHLVMHGSSSVPQYLQDLINANGGVITQTYGVPIEEIEKGIKYGVRKVNIDTDCRMAMSGQFRYIANSCPEELDPRKFIIAAMKELTTLCKERYERFGSAGNASKISIISLDDMAQQYKNGVL